MEERESLLLNLIRVNGDVHSSSNTNMSVCVTGHWSLSAVTHALFHASVLRPASQVGPMHEAAGMGEVS